MTTLSRDATAPTWNDYQQWLGELWLARHLPGVAAPALAMLATDSRTIGPGQWFVPIQGEAFDGHSFIAAAMTRGACGFFYEAKRASTVPQEYLARGVCVGDALAAFQRAAAGWRLRLTQLKLLALTGSAGKTTTKEMLAAALRAAGSTFATQASFNNEIGVPKTLQALTPDLDYAVLEFGARNPGNIEFLCTMAQPDIVGLLNVGTAHLGIFGSVERLLATKLEIFRNSPKTATQVAYADDPRILTAAQQTGKTTLSFGVHALADVRLTGSRWLSEAGTGHGMDVALIACGQAVQIRLGVAHEVLPINVAAAVAMGLAAGATLPDIVRGLTGFSGVKGRYQVHERPNLTIVDDTYNANPDSMRAGLTTVARAYQGRRIALILGDMLELGPSGPEAHERVGEVYVGPLRPALLVTVGEGAQAIAKGAAGAGVPASRIRSFGSVDELLASGLDFAGAADVVYAKGSNGIKLTKLIDYLLDR